MVFESRSAAVRRSTGLATSTAPSDSTRIIAAVALTIGEMPNRSDEKM